MTAIEYIEDIDKDGEDWSNDTSKIADVMEAYAKHYHEQQVKNCLIADVVGRSEQLQCGYCQSILKSQVSKDSGFCDSYCLERNEAL
tara:strand:- start:383 stop:643 length:261 start_codon:yes stop_codon:yes gene_type:complete